MKIKEIRKFLKRLPLWIATNVFKFSLILSLLALIIGAIIFYKYVIFVRKVELEDFGDICPLQNNIYTNVLDVWEKNDQIFEETIDYYNIFSTNLVD